MRILTSNCTDTAKILEFSFLCKFLCPCSLQVLSLLLKSLISRGVEAFDGEDQRCAAHAWLERSDLEELELCSHQA